MTHRKPKKTTSKAPAPRLLAGRQAQTTGAREAPATPAIPFSRTMLRARLALLTLDPQPTRAGQH